MKYIGIFFFNGPLAVNIFFIISGFLITTLLIEERESSGSISLKNFYARRIIRIFPAYYLLILVYFILQCFNYLELKWFTWVEILTFTKQFDKDGITETDHLWSISVEEVFYLLWPFIFIRTKKNAVTVCAILILIITTARVVQFEFPLTKLSKSIFRTGDALLFGCIIALNYESITTWVKKHKKLIWFVAPAAGAAVFIYTYLFYRLANPDSNYALMFSLERFSYGFFGDIGFITNVLVCFIIIYSINVVGLWYKFLNTGFMNHIGKLSYSIYLWQQLYIAEREYLYKIPVPIVIVLIYLTSLISYKLVEKPFLKLKKKFNQLPNSETSPINK